MGDDAEKPTQDKVGHAVGVVRVDEVFKPAEILKMVW
jgi:hypothetical protein